MPKIVDHGQRRIEIADALYRVIARTGLEGASVRAVAAEAGWSMGAVRHYFATQEELLRFGIGLQLERIPARVRGLLDGSRPGRARAGRVLEQLVALDEERLVESQVWLGVLARAGSDPSLDDIRRQAFEGERFLCRGVVCELLGKSWPADPSQLLADRLEKEAVRLHVVLDGLTVQSAAYREEVDGARVRRLIDDELRLTQRRLTSRARR